MNVPPSNYRSSAAPVNVPFIIICGPFLSFQPLVNNKILVYCVPRKTARFLDPLVHETYCFSEVQSRSFDYFNMRDLKEFVFVNDLLFFIGNAHEDKPSKWNIFREDFMMGGKMKDWDKDSDDMEYDNEDKGQSVSIDEESD